MPTKYLFIYIFISLYFTFNRSLFKFTNHIIQWIILLLALVASDTLKLFALFISPNLCKITLQINVTEVKIISSDFGVLNFLSKIYDVFII